MKILPKRPRRSQFLREGSREALEQNSIKKNLSFHTTNVSKQCKQQFSKGQNSRWNSQNICLKEGLKSYIRAQKSRGLVSNNKYRVLTYQIKREGNNSRRIEKLLSKRCWQKYDSKNGDKRDINLFWGQSLANCKDCGPKTMGCKIEGSGALWDKAKLFEHIVYFCSKNKISNQKFLPVTFCFTSRQTEAAILSNTREFLEFFNYIKTTTNLLNSWIFKPTNLNRGQGIKLFNTIEKLIQILEPGFRNRATPESKSFLIDTIQNRIQKYQSINQNAKVRSSECNLNGKDPNYNTSKDIKSSHSNIIGTQLKSRQVSFHIPNSRSTTSKEAVRFSLKNNRTSYGLRSTKPDLNIEKEKKHQTIIQTRSENPSKKLKTESLIELPISKYNQNLHKKEQETFYSSNEEKQLYEAIKGLITSKSAYSQGLTKKEIVIQKYIQNPFLINGKKFDIRVWVLVDHLRNYYVFEKFYLRFSSQAYHLDEGTIKNTLMHLTNHALQVDSKNYSAEDCIVPGNFLKQYIEKNVKNGHQSYIAIMREIERIISISLEATLGKYFRNKDLNGGFVQKPEFQIYGYDFLLDRQLQVRLVQANRNPSITQDSEFLKQTVPTMLDQALNLTVDKVFNSYAQKDARKSNPPLKTVMMWKKLAKLGETPLSSLKNSCQI